MAEAKKVRTLRDMGYGEPSSTPPEALPLEDKAAFPEELQAAQKYAQEQGAANQSWSDWAEDVGTNIKNIATGFLPIALGGRGDIGLSDIAKGTYETAKEGALFPGRVVTGEVPLFDEAGRPTEQAIKGGMAFSNLATIPAGMKPITGLPEKAASNRIRSAIQEDVQAGKARGLDPTRTSTQRPQPLPGAYPRELSVLSEEGVYVSPYDLSGGPKTKSLIESAASKSEEARQTARALQERQTERQNESGFSVANTIDRMAGRPLAIGDEFSAAQKLIQDTNDPNYTAVMSMPEHGGLMSIDLQRIMESRPVFKDIIEDVNKTWANSGRTPPQILDANGKFVFNPNNMPPLEYLDQIYRKLRDETNNAYKSGDVTDANGLKKARDAFRDELDKLSAKLPDGRSSYQMIRDEASDVFGARDALEAGYNYPSVQNGLKASEISKALSSYSPEQLQRFREGLLSRLKEEALKPAGANSGFNKLVGYFDGTNPAMSQRLQEALGDDGYFRLSNQVQVQNIVNKGKKIDIGEKVSSGPQNVSKSTLALIAGAASAAGSLANNVPQIAKSITEAGAITPTTLGAGALLGVTGIGAALYKVAGAIHNKFERAVAVRIANALSSQDPAAISALNTIPPKTLNKYLTRFSYALEGLGVPSGEALKASAIGGKGPVQKEEIEKPKKRTLKDMLSNQQTDVAPENTGGRVARKSGGRIKSNPISAEVRRVRALLSEKTASMLSMPDDAIATALNIAKGKQ